MIENNISATNNEQESSPAIFEQALKLKLDSLIEQIRTIDSSIDELQAEYTSKLEELYSNKKTYEEMLNHIKAILKIETKSSETEISPTYTADEGTSITDSAFSLLQKSHQPMHYKNMASALKTLGIYIPGKEPAATLLSRVSRDERFKRVKRGTYGLKGWHKPKIRKRPVKKRTRKAV